MVRLYNPTEQSQATRLHWNQPIGKTWLASPLENTREKAPEMIRVRKSGTVTLRVEP